MKRHDFMLLTSSILAVVFWLLLAWALVFVVRDPEALGSWAGRCVAAFEDARQ